MIDVLVVGGGPAGTATAIRLARRGVRVAVLERARYPRPKPCGEYMSPGVLDQLHRLGVGEAVEAAGRRLEGFTIHAPGQTFTGRFPNGRHGVGVSRSVMDTLLAEQAARAGAEVREGVRVLDLLYEDGRVAGVRALLDGRRIDMRARLVAGADGVRSVVAHRLGALTPRRGMERIALVAPVGGVEGLGGTGEMHVGREGYCGVAPLGEGIANVAMVLRPAWTPRLRGRAEVCFWEFLATLPGLRGRLERAALLAPVQAIGPLAHTARALPVGGVLLVGDAGGFYDPFTGQGVYKALVSARIAAAVARAALAGGDVSRERLAINARRRQAALRTGLVVEWLVQQFLGQPPLFDRAARRLATRAGMADTLVGVTGDMVSPWRVLTPWYLARLV